MFGYTKEELLQLNVRALLDPEHLETKPIRFDLLAAGENILNERKMVHKNGSIIYVEANSKKFKDDRILAIARDITERKIVEEVLQQSEANLHTIFDTTDTIYVLMDPDLRIISYNPCAFAFAVPELCIGSSTAILPSKSPSAHGLGLTTTRPELKRSEPKSRFLSESCSEESVSL